MKKATTFFEQVSLETVRQACRRDRTEKQLSKRPNARDNHPKPLGDAQKVRKAEGRKFQA
jgi:hypothetical protein